VELAGCADMVRINLTFTFGDCNGPQLILISLHQTYILASEIISRFAKLVLNLFWHCSCYSLICRGQVVHIILLPLRMFSLLKKIPPRNVFPKIGLMQ
jgi:hypothetical protein